MGHKCCGKLKVKRGLWSPEEDEKLTKHITAHGHGSWSSVPKQAGLQRCGKSCRLRWINYLRPELKRGSFTAEEEQIIIDVHRILGNRWAQIAKHLPGRTDNEVKNFWNSCIKKKMISQGLDPKTHNLIPSHKRTTKKVSIADMPLSHQYPFSVITLTDSHIMEGDISMQITTTQPIPKLPSHQYSSTNYTNQLQNNNVQWPIHNPEKYSTNDTIENTPVCPPVASSADPPASFGLLDENRSEGLNRIVEPFVSSGVEGIQQLQREDKRGTENIFYKEMEDLEKGKFAWENRMNSHSLGASTFDLEFVESSLLSSLICTRDLCSMDGLAWNF